MAVKKAVLEGFPKKLEECFPLIQPNHKNRQNISVVKESNSEVLIYFESRSKLVIPMALRN